MVSRLVSVVFSIIIGLLLTWGTGRYPSPLAQIQIDVVGFGIPFPYLHVVIPTQFFSYNWVNFALDFIFWTIITFLIVILVIRIDSSLTSRTRQASS